MQREVWELIEDAPRYLISNQGRVQNKITGRILRPGLAGDGYPQVVLYTDTDKFGRYVHLLVAFAFIPGYFDGAEVNHKDTNKQNNVATNLEWVTHQENLIHASKNGLLGKPIRIVETGEIFVNANECARAIGASSANIRHCLDGYRYHKSIKGYTFEYVIDHR